MFRFDNQRKINIKKNKKFKNNTFALKHENISNQKVSKFIMDKRIRNKKELNNLYQISSLDKEEDLENIKKIYETGKMYEKQDRWMKGDNEKNIKYNIKKLVELSQIVKIRYNRGSIMQEIEKNLSLTFKDTKKTKMVALIYKMLIELPRYTKNDEVIKKYIQIEKFIRGTGCKMKDFFNLNYELEKQHEILYKSIIRRIR